MCLCILRTLIFAHTQTCSHTCSRQVLMLKWFATMKYVLLTNELTPIWFIILCFACVCVCVVVIEQKTTFRCSQFRNVTIKVLQYNVAVIVRLKFLLCCCCCKGYSKFHLTSLKIGLLQKRITRSQLARTQKNGNFRDFYFECDRRDSLQK